MDPDSGASGASGGLAHLLRVSREVYLPVARAGGRPEGARGHGATRSDCGSDRAHRHLAAASAQSEPLAAYAGARLREEQSEPGRTGRQHPAEHDGRARRDRSGAIRDDWEKETRSV